MYRSNTPPVEALQQQPFGVGQELVLRACKIDPFGLSQGGSKGEQCSASRSRSLRRAYTLWNARVVKLTGIKRTTHMAT